VRILTLEARHVPIEPISITVVDIAAQQHQEFIVIPIQCQALAQMVDEASSCIVLDVIINDSGLTTRRPQQCSQGSPRKGRRLRSAWNGYCSFAQMPRSSPRKSTLIH
jgi:hypothetical protein